jgi:protein required for attachment to host cells
MPTLKEIPMEANRTWIVLADEGRARILSREDQGADLCELEVLEDAGAHAHNADFRHDAYGRRSPGAAAQPSSAMSSAGEEKLDHEAELFARRLAVRLAEGHRQHRFDRLRIAAAPRFLGRLRKALDPEVSQLVDEEIDKDLLQLDERTLTQRLCGDSAAEGSAAS